MFVDVAEVKIKLISRWENKLIEVRNHL